MRHQRGGARFRWRRPNPRMNSCAFYLVPTFTRIVILFVLPCLFSRSLIIAIVIYPPTNLHKYSQCDVSYELCDFGGRCWQILTIDCDSLAEKVGLMFPIPFWKITCSWALFGNRLWVLSFLSKWDIYRCHQFYYAQFVQPAGVRERYESGCEILIPCSSVAIFAKIAAFGNHLSKRLSGLWREKGRWCSCKCYFAVIR